MEKENELEKLWELLGDVPVNENDEIDVDFHLWEKGTDKNTIWRWFDDNYSAGVASLLNIV